MATQNEIAQLKEEIEKLSKAVESLQKEKNEDIKKSLEEYLPKDVIEELKNLPQKIDLEKLKEKIPEEKIEEVKEKSKKIIDSLENFTKNHPAVALIGAFGIGYLIGKIKK